MCHHNTSPANHVSRVGIEPTSGRGKNPLQRQHLLPARRGSDGNRTRLDLIDSEATSPDVSRTRIAATRAAREARSVTGISVAARRDPSTSVATIARPWCTRARASPRVGAIAGRPGETPTSSAMQLSKRRARPAAGAPRARPRRIKDAERVSCRHEIMRSHAGQTGDVLGLESSSSGSSSGRGENQKGHLGASRVAFMTSCCLS